MFDYSDLLIWIYATGAYVTFVWSATHKSNFPKTFSRLDIALVSLLWPIFAIALAPLAALAIKEDC